MLAVSHQTSHKVLGHDVIHNVTKFQNCRPDDSFFLFAKNPSQEHFGKNSITNTFVKPGYKTKSHEFYNILYILTYKPSF